MKKSDLDAEQFDRFVNFGRRALLGCGVGLGAVAAAEMLGMTRALGKAAAPASGASVSGLADKGTLGAGQFPGKAKRVIALHMMGAPSQVDTFEYKPALWQMPPRSPTS